MSGSPPGLLKRYSIDERDQKAIDLVCDNAKQLITVAAGILTFTVTFYEKFSSAGDGTLWRLWVLVGAWIAFLASVWCGFRTIGGLTRVVAKFDKPMNVDVNVVTRPAKWQRHFFLFGYTLVISFGVLIICTSKKANQQPDKRPQHIIPQTGFPPA